MIIKRPIYNPKLNCVGFELLSEKNAPLDEEHLYRVIQLITNADGVLPLFIPFELKQLIENIKPQIKNPIILKLAAEDIESVYSLQQLEQALFLIALVINTPQQLAWLEYADYVGLTEQLMSGVNVSRVVKYSKSKQRKVIAYGIEKPVSFDRCKIMGMDYFCGDFVFKPLVNEQIKIAANKYTLLQLIHTIQQVECDLQRISRIIHNDPLLTYQLLRVANSARFSSNASVASIDQAINRLGVINLKNWVMFFSMKNVSNKPMELLESGLIRAHMAQELAKVDLSEIRVTGEEAYTAGLLSILDCLLDLSMSEIVSYISLSEDMANALIYHTGPLGKLLSLVIAYESGDWVHISENNIYSVDLSKLYVDSLDCIEKIAAIRPERSARPPSNCKPFPN